MGNPDFGLRIGLEGERDFKSALADINRAFKLLGSEMQLVASQFEKNDKSAQALTSRNTVLSKEIDHQKEKITTLRAALENAASSFGETDRRTQNWQIQLNKAEAELNNMERELKQNNRALQDAAGGFDSAEREAGDFGKAIDSTGAGLGKAEKETGAFGKALDSAGKELGDAGKETGGLNKALGETEKELGETGKETKNLGKEMDSTGKKTSIFGDVLKASLAADAIKAGISFLMDSIKKIGSAIGGLVLQGGFDRAMNIEQAQFKLKGLGHDVDSIDAIMKNTLASVKGTAYSLGDATAVAAGLVAAGVKAGDGLERALKLVADTAAISGRSMDEMGMIFNKIAASGKMSANEMNQMMKSGIPILQLLSDTMGVSVEKVRELVSQGKIGMPEFQNAIEKGMGGAALAIGETFQGSVDNFKTAFARVGAGFLTPFTQALTPAIGIASSIIDDIAAGATDTIQHKAKELGGFLQTAVVGLIETVSPLLTTAMAVLPEVLAALVPAFRDLLPLLTATVADLFAQLLQLLFTLLPELLPVAVDAVMMIAGALIDNLPLLISAAVQIIVALILGIADALPKLIPAIIEAVILICKTLVDNLPLILQAALQLILGLADGLLLALPELIQELPAIINGIVDFIIGAIPLIIEVGIQLLIAIVKELPTIIREIVRAIPPIFEGIIAALLAGGRVIAEKCKEVFGGIFTESGAFFRDIWETVVSFFTQSIPEFIAKAVGWFKELPSSLSRLLGDAIDSVAGFGINLWNWISAELSKIIQNIVDWFKELPYNLGFLIGQAIGHIINFGIELWTWVTQELPRIITSILDWFKELPGRIWDCLLAVLSRVGDWTKDMAAKAAEAGKNFIDGSVKYFKELPGKVSGFFNDAVSAVKDIPAKFLKIGEEIVKGVWSGIKNMKDWFKKQIGDFFTGIVDGVKGVLGIKSPSKVFAEIGEYMAEGLGQGFNSEMDDTSDDMLLAMKEAGEATAKMAIAAINEGLISSIALLDRAVFSVMDRIRQVLESQNDSILNQGKTYGELLAAGINAGFTGGMRRLSLDLLAATSAGNNRPYGGYNGGAYGDYFNPVQERGDWGGNITVHVTNLLNGRQIASETKTEVVREITRDQNGKRRSRGE